jgi:hypothetical protein
LTMTMTMTMNLTMANDNDNLLIYAGRGVSRFEEL